MTTKTTNSAPLRFIDANILFINPENPRTDMGDLSELVASIRAHGILQPLLVRQEDGAYTVVDGSCRLAAGLQAGLSAFPCLVTTADDDKALEMAVTANIIRKDMSVLDEIRAVGKLAASGDSHAEISTRFGRTPRWVSTRVKISQMPERVLELIGAGDLGIAAAEELCRLGNDEAITELAENAASYEYGAAQIRGQIDRELRGLADAPWVDSRSECARCLHRSDKQVSLFEDGGPARCMDSVCWQAKEAAYIKQKSDELRKAGYLPKQEHTSVFGFVNCAGEILDPAIEQAEIAEMEAAGIKPRFIIDDKAPYEPIFRYDSSDMPEKTEKTSSSDDVPEAEEPPEEEEPAPAFVPQWKRRKEYGDRMRELLRDTNADDIRDASLLRFVAEAYRESTSGANSLDALNDGKCILACNIDDIKRALLVDIVGEFVASEDYHDDAEAIGYWEQFKGAFGISEEKEVAK